MGVTLSTHDQADEGCMAGRTRDYSSSDFGAINGLVSGHLKWPALDCTALQL